MMLKMSALVFSVAAFAAATVFSQSPSVEQDPGASENAGPFSLLLLALSEGGGAAWNPAWPADFPPDAFIVGAKGVRSIELVLESAATKTEEDASSSSAIARWDGVGKLLEFPFASAGSFSPVTVRRSSVGRTIGLRIATAPSASPAVAAKRTAGDGKKGAEKADTDGKGEATTVSFKFASDGTLDSATLEREAERSFSAFRFRGMQAVNGNILTYRSATETRTGEDGIVTAVLDYSFGGGKILALGTRAETGEVTPLIDLDYDSGGRAVSVAEGEFSAEALYDGSGSVAYWRYGETERRFQWDERGLLVRELVSGDGDRFELRYEYRMDAQGNWIERRATRWIERFGSLVSEGGSKAYRTIRYR